MSCLAKLPNCSELVIVENGHRMWRETWSGLSKGAVLTLPLGFSDMDFNEPYQCMPKCRESAQVPMQQVKVPLFRSQTDHTVIQRQGLVFYGAL